jgi:hypothetical protein
MLYNILSTTLASYLGGPGFKSRSGDRHAETFPDFLQSLLADSKAAIASFHVLSHSFFTSHPTILRRIVRETALLNKHYVMRTCEGEEVYLHGFLTSALVGGKWSVLRPGHFIPREKLTVPTGWAPGPVCFLW